MEQTKEQAARLGLAHYINYMDSNYQLAKMHKLIITYLEAVERGDIKRLLINAPPQHSKTSLVGEYFTSWYMGKNLNKRVSYKTYSSIMGRMNTHYVHNKVKDNKFKKIFPKFEVSEFIKETSCNFKTNGTHGKYEGSCILSEGHGFPIDLLIIDSPVQRYQINKYVGLQNKIRASFTNFLYTRIHPNAGVIVINTRWSENDLAAYIINECKEEDWTIVNLKAIAEEDDILGRNVGEALWPEFYNAKWLKETKRSIGNKNWNVLYQQEVKRTYMSDNEWNLLSYFKNIKKLTQSEIEKMKIIFLHEYKKEGAKLNKTAELMNIARAVIYDWCRSDPDFGKEFKKLSKEKMRMTEDELMKLVLNDPIPAAATIFETKY